MKVDYRFYQDTYGGGNIPESSWKRLEQKAVQRIDDYTFGRTDCEWTGMAWENRAKCAVCEMAEILYSIDKMGGKKSENTDGYSVSFESSTTLQRKLYGIAGIYLACTGLMDFEVEGSL